MNDFEFACRVSPRIGELYAEAKRSRRLFPEHALTRLRGMASLCCDMLRQSEVPNWPKGLEEKIALLARSRHINSHTREQLDGLRRWGNSASHPEASRLDPANLPELVDVALTSALYLLETAFRQAHAGASLPPYAVADEPPEELKDVCYRALIDHSAEDQYQVALQLRRQLDDKVERAKASADPFLEHYTSQLEFGKIEERVIDLLRYASDDHPPARYAYGLALAQGQRGEEMVEFGVTQIFSASSDGDINALAWCGQATLFGLHDEPVDYERARSLLEQAAAEDHPAALSLLARMYRDGLGVAADAGHAFGLTLRAAQAGYPLAQYEAAAALAEGTGTQRDNESAFAWLKKASRAGLPEAELAEARLIRQGSLPGDGSDVERLLLRAMEWLNEAAFELADLYVSQADPKKWIEAISLVQTVYERALREQAGELADRCRAVAPAWVAKVETIRHHRNYARLPDEVLNSWIMTRFLFDDYGRPYPNRQQRFRDFMDTAMAAHRHKGSDSSEKERLIRKLASGIAPAPQGGGHRLATLPPVAQRTAPVKVGRNEACPCGSGSKYKACCA